MPIPIAAHSVTIPMDF